MMLHIVVMPYAKTNAPITSHTMQYMRSAVLPGPMSP